MNLFDKLWTGKFLRAILNPIFKLGLLMFPTSIRLLILEKLPVVVRHSFPEAKIYLRYGSVVEFQRRSEEHKKEPDTVEWIKSYFQGGVFFDIGANVGSFSLIAASLKKADQVFAFEPNFTTFHSLCHNIILNNLSNTITPLQIALSDRSGLSSFAYLNNRSGESFCGLQSINNNLGKKESFELYEISLSLDDCFELLKMPHPNYIKLDVDGFELQILSGMPRILANPALKTVSVEPNGKEASEVIDLLTHFDFRIDQDFLMRMQQKFGRTPRNQIFIRS